MATEEYYKNIENCKKDLLMARETFGNKNTTREQYEAMEKSLSFMYVYCQEEIMNLVLSTLEESSKRKIYYEFIWREKND